MTQAPATGLWGCPDDYGPDFVTIDEVAEHAFDRAKDAGRRGHPFDPPSVRLLVAEHGMRCATVTTLLDLAPDLDARGLVLFDLEGLRQMQRHAWKAGYAEGKSLPPDPNTGS